MGITPQQFQAMQSRLERNKTPEIVLPKREKDIHGEIIQFCKDKGWLCFHGAMHKRAWRNLGEPDFQIYADYGRCFLIEAKSKTGKLRPEQIGAAMMAEKLGHRIHCVRSIKEFLEIVKLPPIAIRIPTP